MPSKFDDREESTMMVDMGQLLSIQGQDAVVLSQVAGPDKGRIFHLLPLQELVMGRDPQCEICVDEKPISRQHAKISYMDKIPTVADLKSMNGTFVNGKKVDQSRLKSGDQIQVGTSVFEVAIGREPMSLAEITRAMQSQMQTVEEALRGFAGKEQSSPGHVSVLSGSLREMNLASLFQVLEANRSSGTLVIAANGLRGHVFFRGGHLRHAVFGQARGIKALYRLIVLKDGNFEFFIPGYAPEEETLEEKLERYLLGASRELDELSAYRTRLPAGKAEIVFTKREVSLHKVPPQVFEVMAAVSRYKTLDAILNGSQLPDLEVCRILVMLIKQGVLKASG